MKRSYLIAGVIVIVVTLWLLSGMLVDSDEGTAQTNGIATPGLTRVQVEEFDAKPMLQEVVVQGQTLSRYEVDLKAEVSGEVTELVAKQGEPVSRGDTLLRLAANERPQQLRQARALVAQRELEYEAARSLKDKGLQAERQLAEAKALLQAARVQLRNAELNMARLTVRAPFDGVVQARLVDPGDYLQPGDPVYIVVALDPLVVRGNVAETEVGELKSGLEANAELSNGAKLAGTISYIAPVADSRTRTYAVEMEAPNPAPHQPGGMSATLRIPLGQTVAHKVSPALLSLDDAGVLGLKSVNAQGVVQFYPVEILKSERDGLWLGGLPEKVELITVGQGFVRAGDQVEVTRKQ